MKKLIQLYQVKEEQTALKMGSGDLEVLATPALVAMMENCAKQLLAPELSSEQTSVGFKMTLKHLVPSTVGAEVKVEAEMLKMKETECHFPLKPLTESN